MVNVVDEVNVQEVPLRRNWRFQVLWVGSAFSYLGFQVADIGYPLAILALTGSPGLAGLFGVVQMLGFLIAGLPAGAVADRYDRRRVLLIAEGLRALVVGTVATALAVGHLTMPHLLAAGLVLGLVQPFSGAARMLLIRAVVPDSQLTAALTQDEVRSNGAELAGPPLGGLLYGIGQAIPFLFTALSFVLSWVCALIVRVPPHRPEPNSRAGAGMFSGVKDIWRNPALRMATLLVAAVNTVGAPLVLIAVVILRQQDISSELTGLTLAGMAVGGLVGAALVGPLHRALRPGVLLIGVVASMIPVLVALALPLGPWWMFAVLFAGSLGIPSVKILVDVLIFRQVPDEQRGRVIGSVMTLFGVGAPIGMAAGGLLLDHFPATIAMLVLAGVLAVCTACAVANRELRRATWPDTRA